MEKNDLFVFGIDRDGFHLQPALHNPHISHVASRAFVLAVRTVFVEHLRSVFEFVFGNPMASFRRDRLFADIRARRPFDGDIHF